MSDYFIKYDDVPSYGKLRLIAGAVELSSNLRQAIEKPGRVMIFDYSPISNRLFMDSLFRTARDEEIYISFLNASGDKVLVRKRFRLDENNDEALSILRNLYAEHFDGSIEGSVLLRGGSDGWVIYYDAAADCGLLVEKVAGLLRGLNDFVAPIAILKGSRIK